MLLYKFLCSDLINMSILCIMLKKYCAILLSLPSWECGLKQDLLLCQILNKNVTPFVGVWIEIVLHLILVLYTNVTPFVGVWIEIHELVHLDRSMSVTPFVGVWIEIKMLKKEDAKPIVTPFVGVWIEIKIRIFLIDIFIRHSLRGSVD